MSNNEINTVANLQTIIDGLECVNDETEVFYDVETGDTVIYLDYGDNDITPDELEDERYIKLPDRFEINEYHMMERFAYDHDERLVRAIQGRGAFRYFKDTAEELGLLDEWYEFRDNCYRSRAEDWCRDNDLRWQ